MKLLVKAFPCTLAALGLSTAAQASFLLVNGDFEDATGTFPTGWTGVNTSANVGFIPGSTRDALMTSGGSITQDFSGGITVATAENYNFQLDFAFRTSSISTSTEQRFRLRGHNNAEDLITLGFETAATGGGTALSFFSGTWQTALNVAFSSGTTYYFRVIGTDLDLVSRYFTVGYSTDGVNYTTSGNLNGFHFAGVGTDFETVRFEAGTTTTRIDGVSVVPEPAAALLGGIGLLAHLRRRRA